MLVHESDGFAVFNFVDAVQARALVPAVETELPEEERERFRADRLLAFRNPSHKVSIRLPMYRLPVVLRYLEHRTTELEPFSIVSPERPLKPYDPTDRHMDYVVNAQHMTLARLSIQAFYAVDPAQAANS